MDPYGRPVLGFIHDTHLLPGVGRAGGVLRNGLGYGDALPDCIPHGTHTFWRFLLRLLRGAFGVLFAQFFCKQPLFLRCAHFCLCFANIFV